MDTTAKVGDLATTRPDPELVEAANEIGAGLVVWGPLSGERLTGTVGGAGRRNLRHNIGRFAPCRPTTTATPRSVPVASDLGITAAQLALAWLLTQHPHGRPDPGEQDTCAHRREF